MDASWFETARRTGASALPGERLLTMSIGVALIARPLGVVEHLEGFLELRRDRDVELLAGGQARDNHLL